MSRLHPDLERLQEAVIPVIVDVFGPRCERAVKGCAGCDAYALWDEFFHYMQDSYEDFEEGGDG